MTELMRDKDGWLERFSDSQEIVRKELGKRRVNQVCLNLIEVLVVELNLTLGAVDKCAESDAVNLAELQSGPIQDIIDGLGL